MPRGTNNTLKVTGHSVTTRNTSLECGKKYRGKPNTVNRLVKMHCKLCKICDEKIVEKKHKKLYHAAGLPNQFLKTPKSYIKKLNK